MNNRKKDTEKAVSAVVGIALMVAVTVAMAATVYYQSINISPESGEQVPNIQWTTNQNNYQLEILQGDIIFMYGKDVNSPNLIFKKEMDTYFIDSDLRLTQLTADLSTAPITAGDIISGFSPGSYVCIWTPTDTSLFTIVFN